MSQSSLYQERHWLTLYIVNSSKFHVHCTAASIYDPKWQLESSGLGQQRNHHRACFCQLRWGAGRRGEARRSLPGVGAGDALWLQLSPPAATASPCWQTGHGGARPTHRRARRGTHTGGWLPTLSGAARNDHHSLIKESLVKRNRKWLWTENQNLTGRI